MDLKELEKILMDALQNPNDDEMRLKYENAVAGYLKNHKSSGEFMTIVVNGIDIDHAANYYDYLGSVSRNDLQSIWKQVRENKEIKINKNNNGLKFVSGLLGLALMKEGNMESQAGNIISKILLIVNDDKYPVASATYKSIILDYCVNDINTFQLQRFPKWEVIKTSGDLCKQFAELLLEITDGDTSDDYKIVRQWASIGIGHAEKLIEKEKIESKIPKSMIPNLLELVEHYKNVEHQVSDDEYEIAKLNHTINELQEQVAKLKIEKSDLKNKVETLKRNIEEQKKNIEKAEKEIDKRREINDTFSVLKKKDEEGILNDIAEDLEVTYKQIKGSANVEMTVELGEIYRKMMKKFFDILEKKGIRME